MADQVFLRIGPKHALATDGVQWVVCRAWVDKKTPDGTFEGKSWNACGPFIHSNRANLLMAIRGNGIEISPGGQKALDRLPDTFREWLARAVPTQAPDPAPAPQQPPATKKPRSLPKRRPKEAAAARPKPSRRPPARKKPRAL